MSSKTQKLIKICRLCTNNAEVTIEHDLFAKPNKTLLQQIRDLTGLILKDMSRQNYPRFICSNCKNSLESSYKFRAKIIKSQSYFKSKDYHEALDDLNVGTVGKTQFDSVFISTFDDKTNGKLDVKRSSDESSENEGENLESTSPLRIENVRYPRKSKRKLQSRTSKKVLKRNSSPFSINSHESGLSDSVKEELTKNLELKSDSFQKENKVTIKDEDSPIEDDNEPNDFVETYFDGDDSENSSSSSAQESEDPDFIYIEKKEKIPSDELNDCEELKGQELICYLCKYSFTTYNLLKIHWQSDHKGEKKFIKCNFCEEKLPSIQSLKRHVRSHSGKKAYKCRYCEETFAVSTTRVKHERRNHARDWPFLCTLCGKAFITHEAGRAHMTVHTKERAFKCNICNAAFLLKNHLRTHYRSLTHKNNELKLNAEK